MREVYKIIRRMGVTSKYKGYYYVTEAVGLVMEQRGKPIRITKDIYPRLARKFKSTPVNIEHDIRTVVNVCWLTDKKAMEAIAGYPLQYKPTNSEFIDILAYYILQMEVRAEEEKHKSFTVYGNQVDFCGGSLQ